MQGHVGDWMGKEGGDYNEAMGLGGAVQHFLAFREVHLRICKSTPTMPPVQ